MEKLLIMLVPVLNIYFERTVEFFSKTFYTLPFMIAFQIVAIILIYLKRTTFSELKYFYLYPFASLLQTIFAIYGVVFVKVPISLQAQEATINLFTVIEMSFIFYLSMQVLRLQKLRVALKYGFITFLFSTILCWLFTDAFLHNAVKIIFMEAIVGLLAICFYFIQLFKLPPTINILNEPAFWINIGILFLFSCTLPLTSLELLDKEFIEHNYYFYHINFISYSILHLFIIRASFCRQTRELCVPDHIRISA